MDQHTIGLLLLLTTCSSLALASPTQSKTASTSIKTSTAFNDSYVTLEGALSDIISQLRNRRRCDDATSVWPYDIDGCLKTAIRLKDEIQQCAVTYPATCQGWKNSGFDQNGYYMIDADGFGGEPAFQVECHMNGQNGEAVTIIHHATESRTGVKNCEPRMCAVHDITYSATMIQILNVMTVTMRCDQHIQYDCLHAEMLFKLDQPYVGWFSRDGDPVYSWGGAPTNSSLCACGVTSSCHIPNKPCNCDTNDQTWRTDKGLITDMAVLPVTKLAFGDLGSNSEKGYFTLSPLHCYG